MRKLVILALAALPLVASAETFEDMTFDGMMKMPMVDANKDGKVSKKEFLDMMARMWDAKMKKMNVQGDAVSEAQMREILMYLKAGS